MKSQPGRDYVSSDLIMTPEALASRIVGHFKPTGVVLEPCRGSGNFLKFFPSGALWCEITEGRDFLKFWSRADWVITNPPWSKMRVFLRHSMEVAENVVFLMTINHLWTKARLRDIDSCGFGVKEIIIIDTPEGFPIMGFQLGVVHLKKEHKGDITLTDWRL